MLDQVFNTFGLTFSFADFNDKAAVHRAITPNTKYLFIETPSNPSLHIVDLDGAFEGTFGWGGAAGTVAFVDTKRKLRAVCMAQYVPSNVYPFHADFAKWVLKDLGLPA